MGEHFGQMRFLECQHAAYAQHKLVERQKFGGFLLISRKTVEHTARQFLLIASQYMDHLVLSFATMDHERFTVFYRPLHLFFEGVQLFFLVFSAPIIIQTYLAYGYERVIRIKPLFHLRQYGLVVGLHFFGMQSYHGISEVLI